jgi:peptidyl-prolyl cis-trans isomerase A (cyclophilin A)
VTFRTLLLLLPVLLLANPSWAQKVRLTTSAGDIVVVMETEKAPKTVANFMGYVRSGHYNGVIFHRVIDGFMIQTGGYKPDLTERPTLAPIALENQNDLSNVRGTVAMARTGEPNSATAQFFINVSDNLMLDRKRSRDGLGYAVFGKVVEGMDVVDRIKAVPVRAAGEHGHLPVTPVIIRKASVEQ